MEAPDGIVSRGEDPIDVFHYRIRREATAGPPEVHRAAAWMESEAEPGRHFDLRLEQSARAGRKHIVVIGGGGTATQRQLGESCLGGGPLPVRVDGGPDGVELAQPIEETSLLSPHSSQRLVQVVMGVDQAR